MKQEWFAFEYIIFHRQSLKIFAVMTVCFIAFFSAVNTVKSQDKTSASKAEIYVGTGHTHSTAAISPDGKLVATSGIEIKLWDALTGRELKTIDFNKDIKAEDKEVFQSVNFSRDGKFMVASSLGKEIRIWDMQTDREKRFADIETNKDTRVITVPPDLAERRFPYCSAVALSIDNRLLTCGTNTGELIFWDMENGFLKRRLRPFADLPITSVVFAAGGNSLAFSNGDTSILFTNVDTLLNLEYKSGKYQVQWEQLTEGDDLKKIALPDFKVKALEFGRNNELFGAGSDKQSNVKIWNLESLKLIKNLDIKNEDSVALTNNISLNLEAKILVNNNFNGDSVYDFENEREISRLKTEDRSLLADGLEPIVSLEIQSNEELTNQMNQLFKEKGIDEQIELNPENGDLLTAKTISDSYYLIELKTGEIRYIANASERPTDNPTAVFIDQSKLRAENDKLSVTANSDGSIKIKSKTTGKDVATIYFVTTKKWVIVNQDGRFETNFPVEDADNLHWILAGDWRKPLPLEVFMRQYYEPKLLERALGGESFKPIQSIAEINRIQPVVKIKTITPVPKSSDLVDVVVEVSDVTGEIMSERGSTKVNSGVFDLKLFRDGQLVKTSTTNTNLAAYIENVRRLSREGVVKSSEIEESLWRKAADLKNNAKINFEKDGKAVFKFENVRIPKTGDGVTVFSAYAFNSDRIKSFTDEMPYEYEPEVLPTPMIYMPTLKVADSKAESEYGEPPAPGKVYLISIGVNSNDNPKLNLSYAANDARKIQSVLIPLLKQNDNFTEVISVPLISEKLVGKAVHKATKPIIKAVFSLLAGKKNEIPAEILAEIPNVKAIKPVNPEDTIIISFSGHGYADRNGVFYLIPSDTGKETDSFEGALDRSISSDELSLWFQDITAQEMLFIIDACHSSTAVQGKEFKPGPMGSRGLGQLAYDKGMRILAATQADNVALESAKLEQGLLTYTLIQESLVEGQADALAPGRELSIDEWWNLAVWRVPAIYKEIKNGKRVVKVNGKIANIKTNPKLLTMTEEAKPTVNTQKPTIFNFRREKKPYTFLYLPETIEWTPALESEKRQRSLISTPLKILSRPKAKYTDEAKANQVQGTVRLRVAFGSTGQILSVTPINSLPFGLTEQAIIAAKAIKFEPEVKNGEPVTVVKTVSYDFTLY